MITAPHGLSVPPDFGIAKCGRNCDVLPVYERGRAARVALSSENSEGDWAVNSSSTPSGIRSGVADTHHDARVTASENLSSRLDVERHPASQGQFGMIQEVDASWNVVQTITASAFGYAEWRETLYGPPLR
jgi:hypothetical protein